MAGESRTTQDEIMMEVAKLDRRGYLEHEIARAVKIPVKEVKNVLKRIQKLYAAETFSQRTTLVEEMCWKLRDVRAELWKAWDRSKDDATRLVEEKVPERDCAVCSGTGEVAISKRGATEMKPCKFCHGGKVGGLVKTVSTVEGRLAAAEYMRLIVETLKDERKLRGLDQPTKVQAEVSVLNWDALIEEAHDNDHNVIEGRILKALEMGGDDQSLGDLPSAPLPLGLKEMVDDSTTDSHSSSVHPPQTNGHVPRDDNRTEDEGNSVPGSDQ